MRVRNILLLTLVLWLLIGSAGIGQNVDPEPAALSGTALETAARAPAAGETSAESLEARLVSAEQRLNEALLQEDASALKAARRDLEELSRQAAKADLAPQTHIALGFSYLGTIEVAPDRAWTHFEKALSYWAGDRRVDLARERYLSIIRRLTQEAQSVIIEAAPLDLLQDVIKIAQTPEDVAMGHFLVARKLSRDPSTPQRARAGLEYAAAAAQNARDDLRAEILYRFGQWAAENGATNYSDQGELILEPDYAQAVSLYEQVLEIDPESRFAQQARREIEAIRRPSLSVRVPNTFRPNTQAHVVLLRRNVEAADLRLYPLPVDRLTPQGQRLDDWLAAVDVSSLTPVYETRVATPPERPHLVVSNTIWIETSLNPGVYLVTAVYGEQNDRELLFVGERAMVLKVARNEALLYFCDAATGAPAPGATVKLLTLHEDGWRSQSKVTGANGIARFTLPEDAVELVGVGTDGVQHALVTHRGSLADETQDAWKVFPYAARDVYFAGEKAFWKVVVRQDLEGALKLPPSDEQFRWEIYQQAGTLAASGIATLTPTGSLAGEVVFTKDSPLGAYYFRLLDSQGNVLGGAPLLQLLETGAEQITADIQLQTSPQGPGYSPGEVIRGTARLSYGFGGPVANAELELQVVEIPKDSGEPAEGTAILHQALRTDSQGMASFEFPTLPDRDARYSVELRAQDSTGLTARARQTVHVSQQNVQVSLIPQKRLFLEGETVRATLQVKDAAGQPLALGGQMRLLRDYWREVWVDRRGREISGKELRELETSSGGWFSFGPSPRDYRLKSEGYQTVDVTEAYLFTDNSGAAQFTWEPAEPGYYRLIWVGEERRGRAVRAMTSFWVAGESSDDIGYRPNTVRLIVNDEPIRPGEPFPVLIATPAAGRRVLVTGGRRELELAEVLTLPGTARLVRLTLPDGSESVHTLEATMIAEGTISMDRTQVVASETTDQLRVSVIPSAERYGSKDDSEWLVRVSDGNGRPVAGAEVSLSISNADATGRLIRPSTESYFLPHREDALQSTSSLEQSPFFMPLQRDREEELIDPDVEIFQSGQPQFMIDRDASGTTLGATVLWLPSLVTGEQGEVKVVAPLPGISTDWIATARAIAGATAFGESRATATTRLPLTARANLARTVQVGDEPGFLLTLNNHTASERTASLELEVSGELELAGDAAKQEVTIPPNTTLQVSWPLEAFREGEGTAKVTLRSGEDIEVIERQVTILPRRRIITSARTYGGSNQLTLELPENVRELSPQLEIIATPSLSAIAVGMAPELLETPRETTQENLLRFAPGLVVTGILRTLGYEDSQINSHAGFDLTGALQSASKAGIETLRRLQRASGGWGWREGEPEDTFISAYTVILLTIAAEAGAEIPESLLERGRIYLGQRLAGSSEGPDRQAWQLLALATRYKDIGRPTRLEANVLIDLIKDQDRLSGFGLAAVALAARDYGLHEEARILVDTLQKRVRRDENGGAYWSAPSSFGNLSDFETTALALRALLVTQGPSRLSNEAFAYLLSQPPHMLSTREKATLVVTLAQLAYETGEIEAEADFDITLNGQEIGHGTIEPWSALSARYRWNAPPSLIRGGLNHIEVKGLSARSPVVLSAHAQWTPSGRESGTLPTLSVERRYLRTKLAPTLLRGLVEEVEELGNPGAVTLGDRLTSVITVRATELARRVVIEDPRPPLAEVIGGSGPRATPITIINQEHPEQRVAAYVRHDQTATLYYIPDLPPGTWELRVPMRVESLGVFDVSSVRAVISPRNNEAASGLNHRLEARRR